MDNYRLEQAKNRVQVFESFLQMEIDNEANIDKLAFLDQGIENSPYLTEIENYYDYLQKKPLQYKPYPKLGEIPSIEEDKLNFLHPQITEACISLGKFVDGELKTLWLGKNALNIAQFWSATKIISILNVFTKIAEKPELAHSKNLVVRDAENPQIQFPLNSLIEEVVTYQEETGSSNSISALFKRFENRINLENWFKSITGNLNLKFQGDYGEEPFIKNPEVFDVETQNVILKAAEETTKGDNLVSAYDLTRIISLIGWYAHLPTESQLAGVTIHTLKSLIQAMGKDPARYTDVALEKLGIAKVIKNPVILSKMGHGDSQIRQSLETVYMAFIQLILPSLKPQEKLNTIRTLAITLRGVVPIKNMDDFTEESFELDARMAAEVTEILRRVVTDELDKL